MSLRSSLPASITASLAVLALVGCGNGGIGADPARGVAADLAERRAATLRDVRYDFSIDIPADPSLPVSGRVEIRFALTDPSRPLVVDFAPGADHILSVAANGRPAAHRVVNGHIVVAASELAAGDNAIDIRFRAGGGSLNRNADFMYTLFVPARAHHAVPVFDQPDLKARFTLELTVPADWQAVSNGAELSRQTADGRVTIRYAETEPIPTYLFAFAAGRFSVETAERGGREYRMLHRETDAAKVSRNRDEVFDLHAAALDWLERYTGIDYPFGKFDFVLIPSFQFNGMEHPGAIYYRDSSILLDESATENDLLDRARVIAHETAHMWFGDLVTMRWFDDVWMKEVFANFIAAKIVEPAFPGIDHDLRFLVAHHPVAYSVDRTAGTHPIRQPLDNLDDAGSLYGPIIYQKAPIVMRQLELLIGTDAFREGLRTYLERFAFGNATWLDLVTVLDRHADFDVAEWSRAWVEEAGRPSIRTDIDRDADGRARRITLVQSDPSADRNLIWAQRMNVLLASSSGRADTVAIDFARQRVDLPAPDSLTATELVLPPAGGLAYGDFELDAFSREFLLARLPRLDDAVARGAGWITLWDELLRGQVPPTRLMALALDALPQENTEQNILLILNLTRDIFWRFLSSAERAATAPRLETTLLAGLEQAPGSSLKAAWFDALRSTVTTPQGVARLERIWRRTEPVDGLTFSESDEADMALELAVRGVDDAAAILETQLERFQNPDRRARFEFVMPALSPDERVRDAFFESLADPANRRREPWVVEALEYLNHPLRSASAEKHIEPALGLLPEIRRTGDIFFPKNWTDAVLSGHRMPGAAAIVREFLTERRDLPEALRRVVLQSAHELFRAADLAREESPDASAPDDASSSD